MGRSPAPYIFYKKPRRIRNTKPWTGITQRQNNAPAPPEFNQAEKIVAKLGGPGPAAKLIGVNPSSIYRWMHAKGGNGLIPTRAAAEIRRVARREGILLTKDDWNPELRNIKDLDNNED